MRALSRKYANRKSTLRNLATSLVLYERITTTTAKAKELKPIIERLMSIAQKNDLMARRRLMQYLFDEKAVLKTLEVLVPRFKNIKSGYVKTYHLGPRLGDGADMMIIELVHPVKSGGAGSQSEISQGKGEKKKEPIKEENAKSKENRVEKTRKTTTKEKPSLR